MIRIQELLSSQSQTIQSIQVISTWEALGSLAQKRRGQNYGICAHGAGTQSLSLKFFEDKDGQTK